MTATLPSLAKPKPNPAWAKLPLFDRKGWKRMAFGDFAQSIGERAEPKDAQEEIYVGLEHLDPRCLHIRRWGKGSDVIGGKLRFRKGDIIFGKRRAYQRKLAVAEFGGICSAHAMVIRARPDKVLPEFLPFLMMSYRFMNRAVEISVGSLSPTINWTTLKLETFDLPPLDQQRRIAEILWAVDETNEAFNATLTSVENAVFAFSDSVFGEKSRYANNGSIALGDVCKLQSGYPFKSSEFVEVGDRLLRGSNVGVDRLDWRSDITKCFPPERRQEVAEFILKSGDIVIAMDRPFISEGFKIARVGCERLAGIASSACREISTDGPFARRVLVALPAFRIVSKTAEIEPARNRLAPYQSIRHRINKGSRPIPRNSKASDERIRRPESHAEAFAGAFKCLFASHGIHRELDRPLRQPAHSTLPFSNQS